MAEYPDPYRPELRRILEAQQQKKATNLINISVLQSENDILDDLIAVGESAIAQLNADLDQSEVTGFNIILDGGYRPVLTWDDAGVAKTYEIERSFIGDFTDAVVVYTGAYNSGFVDTATVLNPGETYSYRIKVMEDGMDDSDWVTDTITRP